MMQRTIPGLLIQGYRKYGNTKVAMRKKDLGIWYSYTWAEYHHKVKYIALGMKSLGLERGNRVAILGDNDPEWFWIQIAAHAMGGIAVGAHTEMMASEVKYVLEHSDSAFIAAKDQEQIDKVLMIKHELPELRRVFFWDERGLRNYDEPILMSINKLIEAGIRFEEDHPTVFEEEVNKATEDDYANYYYTSGTTGAYPKAAMVSHRALIGSAEALHCYQPWDESVNSLSLVPASVSVECIWGLVSQLLTGSEYNFPEEPETVFTDIREISPPFIALGPRQWESWVRTIQLKTSDSTFFKRLMYRLLLPIGYKIADQEHRDKNLNPFWKVLDGFSYWMVFRPVLDKLGLRRASRGSFTGSAAISPDLLRFMSALRIKLRQSFNTTEGGTICAHPRDDIKFESIGRPLPGSQIRVTVAGEMLIKSERLFSGYHKDPEATSERIKNGWFRTGDSVHIDEDGHVIYLDRISELNKLVSGIVYAPSYIEGKLRFSPFIKEAMTVGGEHRDYVTAIVNIDFDNVGKWAESNRIPYTTLVDLSQKDEVASLIRKDIMRINKTIPEGATLRKYVLLHKEFDTDEAELTRTKKLRRGFTENRYSDLIEAMYKGDTEVPVETEVKYRDGRTGFLRTAIKIRSVA